MSVGIVSWGAYLPYWRLQRSAIGATLGGASGRGTRTVASFDEDTTTMGVEASRRALAALDGDRPSTLLFATPSPAYTDKTNATAIHAALELPEWAGAYDLAGSVRSSVGAVRAAAAMAASGGRTMAVLSDLRTGLAGSADERDGGDGAVALVFGDDGVVAELVGHAATSAEFLDRWRTPGEIESRQWEERFGEEVYLPLVEAAFTEALKAAGLSPDDVDRVAVSGLQARVLRSAAKALGIRDDVLGHRPQRQGRQPRRGAARTAPRRRPRHRGPGRADRAGGDRRRCRRVAVPDHRAVAAGPGSADRGRPTSGRGAGDGRPRRPSVRPIPDVARRAAPRAAPPSRPRAPRRARHVAVDRMEERVRREPLPRVWVPPPAADAGVPEVQGHRPDGARYGSPTSGAGSPPSPSTTSPTACRRRSWVSSSISTAAVATGVR